LALIEAIDRAAFGAHFDPVNLINSPRRYYDNAALIREEVRTGWCTADYGTYGQESIPRCCKIHQVEGKRD